MSNWKQVNRCPCCGGQLVVMVHYAYTLDHKVTKKGEMSKKFRRSIGGPIDCTTMGCQDCGEYWDASQMVVEWDDTVWIKENV